MQSISCYRKIIQHFYFKLKTRNKEKYTIKLSSISILSSKLTNNSYFKSFHDIFKIKIVENMQSY